ncbi:hypothetical protein HN512_02680 [Candidatus Peregrinibacteria bacterium]|jgi:hypothetical protein|nr:hypothetical protein [Candidatus Peregrinibacteria bacterium]MBT3598718.1 hypothetical protein [Candidatus Peregrinibacteria bacterium]MBT4367553.1 hypothetical protein [Candidatus Peregrinibacteria bacterium]MBT4585371.1 hypothetical protein [Candidatus Peregrinibacteria bacterium]MBT6731272.1 hypothetical protein [Candidatus Peregrinibacteria bacterium]
MIQTFLSKITTYLVPRASAGTLSTGGFGIEAEAGVLTSEDILLNIINVGVGTVSVVCSAIFIAGAFFFASSAGNDQRKSLGKDLMVGAIMGIAIIAAAKGIINLTYSFLYAA